MLSAKRLRAVRELEGRHVSVTLSDGSRIDDCWLVSAGRGDNRTLWLYGEQDLFVPLHHVIELWESAPVGHEAA